jgi:cell wall-associated NlpC family hydrolase
MQTKNTYFSKMAAVIGCLLLCVSCAENIETPIINLPPDSINQLVVIDSSLAKDVEINANPNVINTGNITPTDLLTFARTLKGVPYKYGSANPDSGFDCSGFITYVFNHFGVTVPRASASFINIQREISLADAQPGDIILFTGTDTAVRAVGHMGIVEHIADSTIYFIHASSGKANGVTISPLDVHYKSRFVKALRVF